MVRSVGLIEPEDDVVLVLHRVVDVVHPRPVLLKVAGDHGHEGLACWWGATGAGGAGAEVFRRSFVVVRSDPPVVPPTTDEQNLSKDIKILSFSCEIFIIKLTFSRAD